MSEAEISIRSIQHYLYCPHRWGLMEIDRAWAENAFVTKANLMHSRVHDPDRRYTAKGKRVYTSVSVYNDLYGLYGVTDCLELTEAEDGVSVDGSREKYRFCIVEYKPTQPRDRDYNEDDLMQVFAQKICVDHVFGCDCDAVIYYSDTKKRIRLPLREGFDLYDGRLKETLSEMRNRLNAGIIPEIRKGQKCSGCSMSDLCMPSLKQSGNFRADVEAICNMEF